MDAQVEDSTSDSPVIPPLAHFIRYIHSGGRLRMGFRSGKDVVGDDLEPYYYPKITRGDGKLQRLCCTFSELGIVRSRLS